MTSYSEILYLIAAMVVFSFLSLNTAKSFNNSRQTLYIAEAESRAIAVAQDELDKVQWIYDPNDLNPNSASYVYANYPIIETQSYGNNDQYTSTFIISGTSGFDRRHRHNETVPSGDLGIKPTSNSRYFY